MMSTTTTAIKTEKRSAERSRSKLIPELRFKEFEGDWEKKQLGEVSDKIQDGTHFSPQLLDEGNYKYITSRNIRNGYMELSNVPYISDEAHHDIYKRCNVRLNDILLTKDGSATGTVCLNTLDEEFSLLSSVAFIRANDSIAINEFIYQCIAGPIGQREILASIAGQAITRITLTKLRNFKFSYPSLPEQQKIASFLSSVDQKIQQLTTKKELLEQYKKGVMQQLFSGQLRFKNEKGDDYPDWEEKRLGEIADITKLAGFEFTKHIVYRDEGKIIALRGLNIKNNTLDLNQVKYIDDSDFTKLSRSKLFVGDLMYTYVGTIGEVAIIEENDRFYLAPNVSRIRFIEDECLAKFAIQYFINPVFKEREVGKYISSSSQPALSMTNIRKFKILLPSNPEQQKIATYLSSIDTKIEDVNTQITQTQTFKKGLLQQMFV